MVAIASAAPRYFILDDGEVEGVCVRLIYTNLIQVK